MIDKSEVTEICMYDGDELDLSGNPVMPEAKGFQAFSNYGRSSEVTWISKNVISCGYNFEPLFARLIQEVQ